MELLTAAISLPCWECHGITRCKPCEHCHCENPEENRNQVQQEQAAMATIEHHLGQGLILRCLHNDFEAELIAGVFQRALPPDLDSVPLRLIEIMHRNRRIWKLTEDGDNGRAGWRELGLDGDMADFYVLTF